MVSGVLESCHGSYTDGHLNLRHSLAKVKEKFFWYLMKTYIGLWVRKYYIISSFKPSPKLSMDCGEQTGGMERQPTARVEKPATAMRRPVLSRNDHGRPPECRSQEMCGPDQSPERRPATQSVAARDGREQTRVAETTKGWVSRATGIRITTAKINPDLIY